MLALTMTIAVCARMTSAPKYHGQLPSNAEASHATAAHNTSNWIANPHGLIILPIIDSHGLRVGRECGTM